MTNCKISDDAGLSAEERAALSDNVLRTERALASVADAPRVSGIAGLISAALYLIERECPEPALRIDMLNALLAPTLSDWSADRHLVEGIGATRQ